MLKVALIFILAIACSLPIWLGQSNTAIQSKAKSEEKPLTQVVQSSLSSVVLIVVSDSSGKEVGQGSGFIVSSDGKILTNYHVIKGARTAVIKLSNGSFFSVEGMIAFNEDDDLALIKVQGSGLPVLALGNSEEISVGEKVVAIGSPLGLQNTVTDGIISAIREEGSHRKWIQTTSPVSPGNSGGPLLNLRGEVIGITTFRIKGGENLNFAAPSNSAQILLNITKEAQPLGSAANAPVAVEDAKVHDSSLWTSLTTGHDYKVRRDGDYIYTEWMNLPAALNGTVAFARTELKKNGENWAGTGRSSLPCQYTSKFPKQTITNWCSLQSRIEITSVSDSRIEGRAEISTEFDCKKCEVKKTEWRQFSWIPKE